RGRVGRGSAASSCVLLYQAPLSALARQRLETMRATSDGFEIAEQDLALRGPGELLGTRQTGLAGFRVADLARDAGMLPQVQLLGDRLLAEAPATADRLVSRWIGGAARHAAARPSNPGTPPNPPPVDPPPGGGDGPARAARTRAAPAARPPAPRAGGLAHRGGGGPGRGPRARRGRGRGGRRGRRGRRVGRPGPRCRGGGGGAAPGVGPGAHAAGRG